MSVLLAAVIVLISMRIGMFLDTKMEVDFSGYYWLLGLITGFISTILIMYPLVQNVP